MRELKKVANSDLTMEVKETQKATILKIDTTPLRNLMEQRKNLIVKINDTYEITRPLALELLKMIREQALQSGVNLTEETHITPIPPDGIAVEIRIKAKLFKDQNGNFIPEDKQPTIFQVSEIGEAYHSERGKKEETIVRVAYTRALKRALERLVGEDFINQVILQLFKEDINKGKPATEKQINLIKKLLKERGKKINEEKLKNLTMEQANKIISKLIGDKH
jgi:hypothetical protein